MKNLLQKFLDSKYGYLYCIDNWHKHPWLSKLMCKLGRHDYEFKEEVSDYVNHYVVLYCFYCLTEKHCHLD